MSNEITIYRDSSAYNRLSTIANKYSYIFRDFDNIVDLLKKQQMQIFTLLSAKSDVSRIYLLSSKNKKIVDKKFNCLYIEKKMLQTIQSIEYDYFVFVIWRTINKMRKSRVVINIRDLNKISIFDVYSISLQSDVLVAIIEFSYISIIDCASFFYQ